MISIDLSNRVALLTGAGGSIGSGIATVLAGCGAKVAITDINLEAATDVAQKITEKCGVRAISYEIDVTSEENVIEVVDKVKHDFGRIDIYCPAAGLGLDTGNILATSTENARKMMDINTFGTAFGIKAALKYMLEQHYGRIVLIGSLAARRGGPQVPWYSASKAGVISIMQSTALAYVKEGINCNAVCPGVVETPGLIKWFNIRSQRENRSVEEIKEEFIGLQCPQGKMQTPEDIGYAVSFLASPLSDCINGQALNVCGGSRLN